MRDDGVEALVRQRKRPKVAALERHVSKPQTRNRRVSSFDGTRLEVDAPKVAFGGELGKRRQVDTLGATDLEHAAALRSGWLKPEKGRDDGQSVRTAVPDRFVRRRHVLRHECHRNAERASRRSGCNQALAVFQQLGFFLFFTDSSRKSVHCPRHKNVTRAACGFACSSISRSPSTALRCRRKRRLRRRPLPPLKEKERRATQKRSLLKARRSPQRRHRERRLQPTTPRLVTRSFSRVRGIPGTEHRGGRRQSIEPSTNGFELRDVGGVVFPAFIEHAVVVAARGVFAAAHYGWAGAHAGVRL